MYEEEKRIEHQKQLEKMRLEARTKAQVIQDSRRQAANPMDFINVLEELSYT